MKLTIEKLISVALLGGVFGSATANAATASYTVNAGAGSGFVGFLPSVPIGSVSGGVTSDGKTIVADAEAYGGSSPSLLLKITGFSANPSKSYFTGMAHNCAGSPIGVASASSTYSYDSSSGTAMWVWVLASHCMANVSGQTYSVTLF